MPSPEKKDKTRRGARRTSEVQKKIAIVSTVGPRRVRLALPWETGKKKAACRYTVEGSHAKEEGADSQLPGSTRTVIRTEGEPFQLSGRTAERGGP
jgi:hypothetical protein